MTTAAAGQDHVLLIGIDAYDGGGMLTGCVNDIDAIQRVLIDRVGIARARITRLAAGRSDARHETDVPAQLPTLANISSALTKLGNEDIGHDDRVFIYYSGHGTQMVIGADERRFSREALLPKDKKSGAGYRLLFDWELNGLVARILDRTPRVTFILDCCSSSGATRGGNNGASQADRFWPMPGVEALAAGDGAPPDSLRGVAAGLGGLQRCQVVAACRDDERARESLGSSAIAHGELTRALVAQLSTIPDENLRELRWGHVWRGVEATVRAANPRQNPRLLGGGFGRTVFGFGADEHADPGYAITTTPAGYHVDAGTLAGVTDDATIAVYGAEPTQFPALGTPEDMAARRGIIRVKKAGQAESEAVAIQPFVMPDAARGRLVSAGQIAKLRVCLAPADAALDAMLRDSPLVELVQEGGAAELTLVRSADGDWALTDDVYGAGGNPEEPVLAFVPANRLALARALVEHYHAYVTPLRMARMCRDLPEKLSLSILDCGQANVSAASAQDPELPPVPAGTLAPYEVAVDARVCFVVHNTSDVTLYVTLLDAAASGRVQVLGEKPIPRKSKHVFWYGEKLGEPFPATLRADRAVGVDRIVAIGTTRPDVSLRHLERSRSFEDLVSRRRDRTRGDADADKPDERAPEPVEAWTSTVTAVRIDRRARP